MDYTVHGILQARIQEWIAFPFSREFSQPRDWTQVSNIAGGFFTSWAIWEALDCLLLCIFIFYMILNDFLKILILLVHYLYKETQ